MHITDLSTDQLQAAITAMWYLYIECPYGQDKELQDLYFEFRAEATKRIKQ